MKTYLITYQLNKEWQNYHSLHEAIKNYKYIVHSMKSVWFIKTDLLVGDIYNDLSRYIDKNDFLFISEVTLNHYWRVTQETVNFLQ